ncbi:Crp/Fnr family transcriptional regulator [Sneathiella sp.]|uniref:Crp/Fnr family transcriptional regulator n=1 Tax=Sneathiella sp. TaxID=1964365 RepID=UPI002FE1A1BB
MNKFHARLDLSLISDLPPFRDLAGKDLAALVAMAMPRHYSEGASVFRQGEAAHSFFLLLDGVIRVVKITPAGEQVIARYIPSGQLFGIAQALRLDAYPANAIAAIDCLALAWPGSAWTAIVERFPPFAASTYQTVGLRLQETQDQLVELATKRVGQRVAGALLRLGNDTGRRTPDGIQITVPLSRQDVAEMAGTTLHTVSRLLSRWEENGIVRSSRLSVVIKDASALAKIADAEREI